MNEPKRTKETLKIDRYDHGGARIYFEDGNGCELVADTYQEKDREVIFEAIRATVSPVPAEAREDEALDSPRAFAERLAWMTRNGKPDLDQWENHIRHRDAALRSRRASLPPAEDAFDAAMRVRGGLSCDVVPAGKTTYTHKLLSDKEAAAEIESFAESRVEPWREAIRQAEKDFDELGGAREPNYDWEGVRSYALICRNQMRALLSGSPAKEGAK